MTKRIYDLTLNMSPDMVVFPGDPHFTIQDTQSIRLGDGFNLSLLSFGSHTGTHVDAPRHILENGLTIDQCPLEYFLGMAKVFAFSNTQFLDAADLAPLPIMKDDIVLFKTRNSEIIRNKEFSTHFVYLTPDAGKLLAERGIRTVGFDYWSVEKYGNDDFQVHYALLSAGIVIIEGLDLSAVAPGEYQICALPLKISDGDGSPARVILLKDE
jgi:arylformamidase